ncbi:MAG: dihydroorotate dehydrogenase (fumarate) [Bacillariaceae sp.]|jgi:dihydroorotate dehydrogenase (fumarate)
MSNINLETTVGGIPLSSCVYNASGPRTGASSALAKIAASKAGAVLTKSATIEKQMGNPQPRVWHSDDDIASMNSEGLPNSGIDYYLSKTTIDETMEGCTTTKPYLVSISGKTLADNLEMLDRIAKQINDGEKRIAGVELNLACPNVIGKPIIAYDFDQMRDILDTIAKKKYTFVLGLKLPPYLDSKHLQEAASIINEYSKMVRYVVCINTLGNALSIDPISEMPFISANNGLAGLSGPAAKFTALANVRQMRQQLKSEIDVIGVGGIQTGEDAFLFLLCGASAVQVGTCHWKEGPKCFDRIVDELQQILQEKGYSCASECIGKLKPWSKEGAAKTRAEKKKLKKNDDSQATSSTAQSTKNGGIGINLIFELVLVLVVAVLLAEKYGMMKL